MLNYLCADSVYYKNLEVPEAERRNIVRALMNIRRPEPVSDEFIQIQDAFLKQEASEKGIVEAASIPSVRMEYGSKAENDDKISLWKGDITRLKADAIVNAANPQMLGCFVPCHGCIDNAIHSAAGVQLRGECASYMEKQRERMGGTYEEAAGNAVITPGFNLPSRYVLHTVGPIVAGKLTERDCVTLKSCYVSCLKLADKNKLSSIVFCCISTGEFHFPNREAAEIAVSTVREVLPYLHSIDRIVFNVFKEEDDIIYKEIFMGRLAGAIK